MGLTLLRAMPHGGSPVCASFKATGEEMPRGYNMCVTAWEDEGTTAGAASQAGAF